MCLYPNWITNKKYTSNKKNSGVVPKLPGLIMPNGKIITDERVKTVGANCGKCMECKNKKRIEWTVRLTEELKNTTNERPVFVTFTFNTEELSKLKEDVEKEYRKYEGYVLIDKINGYNLDNKIAKLAVKRFLGRWRKDNKVSIKHWFVTELGSGEWEHMHLHGIIWTNENEQYIQQKWKYGNIWTSITGKTKEGKEGYVSEQTINYIVKYINKTDKLHPNYKQIVLTSPGMGKGYLESPRAERNAYKGKDTKTTYILNNGQKIAIPGYYRKKIYTDDEREELWRDMLDEGKMYVMKEKIDIRTAEGWDNYIGVRNHYREINIRLGYGTNAIDISARRLEDKRRNDIYMQRCKERRLKPLKATEQVPPSFNSEIKRGKKGEKNNHQFYKIKKELNEILDSKNIHRY